MTGYSEWRETFKYLRLQAGYASQGELADAFSKIILHSGDNLILSGNDISRYETDDARVPKIRGRHLALIECFYKLGSLKTVGAANAWLALANQGNLHPESEIEPIFGKADSRPAVKPDSTRILLMLDISLEEFLERKEVIRQFFADQGINLEYGQIIPGSVLVFVDLPAEHVIELYRLFKTGKLADIGITEVRLGGANLGGIDLSNADFSEADLSGADLRDAILHRTNLKNANLNGSDLGGADLSHADLRGANLAYANLRGSNFNKANLSNATLNSAQYDGDTRWPDEVMNILGKYISNSDANMLYLSNLLMIPPYTPSQEITEPLHLILDNKEITFWQGWFSYFTKATPLELVFSAVEASLLVIMFNFILFTPYVVCISLILFIGFVIVLSKQLPPGYVRERLLLATARIFLIFLLLEGCWLFFLWI